MKKLFFALTIAAALLSSSCKQEQKGNEVRTMVADSTQLNIAFVNTDTLLSKYEYALKVSDNLNDKAENSRASYNQKLRIFNQELAEFQRKVQNNGFLSMERAQSEQTRLQNQERELQALNQQLTQELMQEQARLTAELRDTVANFLNEYAQGRYQLILNNNISNDIVLYAVPAVDITEQVVDALNARYNISKSGKN
ncbi:MAG: OmpH family outer membrane protein [Bacteroidales bacterium]|nr:OmpH family outer membrane protein [Bacteroidales bacterium]MDD7725449.1 OmpH family outer membrane protein [Bacteroidales bacterium]MDY4174345.1 OmpH family outer membrane protein [Bacteroidales bacterium]